VIAHQRRVDPCRARDVADRRGRVSRPWRKALRAAVSKDWAVRSPRSSRPSMRSSGVVITNSSLLFSLHRRTSESSRILYVRASTRGGGDIRSWSRVIEWPDAFAYP
jgi:hypothetical protein